MTIFLRQERALGFISLVEGILNKTHTETIGDSLADQLSIDQIEAFPQRFILSQCLFITLVRNLKYVRERGIGEGKR